MLICNVKIYMPLHKIQSNQHRILPQLLIYLTSYRITYRYDGKVNKSVKSLLEGSITNAPKYVKSKWKCDRIVPNGGKLNCISPLLHKTSFKSDCYGYIYSSFCNCLGILVR